MPEITHAGNCAILGATNTGKSTFLNAALGQKIAIATPIVQTTRQRIIGVLLHNTVQVALVDTPGLHRHKGALNRRLMQKTLQTLSAVDAVALLVDVSKRGNFFDAEADKILKQIRKRELPCVLVLNKIDRIKKPALLPMLARSQEIYDFAAVVPISASKNDGVQQVIEEIAALMPEGDPLYDKDIFTDQTEREICSELIREQLIIQTRQEIPHSVVVSIDQFDESRRSGKRPIIDIAAKVWVERDSQKAIVIGAGGRCIKAVGVSSRKEMERMLDSQVMLRLEVEVAANWSEDPKKLDRFGLGEL